jgi:hypothetical protein
VSIGEHWRGFARKVGESWGCRVALGGGKCGAERWWQIVVGRAGESLVQSRLSLGWLERVGAHSRGRLAKAVVGGVDGEFPQSGK